MDTLGSLGNALKQRVFDAPLLDVGGTTLTLMTIGILLSVILITLLASRLAQKGLRRALHSRGNLRRGQVEAAARLLHYSILVIGAGVALETVGVDLDTLFATGAIFAVGVGFAMRNIAENFVAGVILLLERVIKPGDMLHVEGRMVEVLHMSIRSTVVRTRSNEEVIVPNSTLVQTAVTNYTLNDMLYWVSTRVGVSYASCMHETQTVLTDAAAGLRHRAATHAPRVFLEEFGNSSIVFRIAIATRDPWEHPGISSDLNVAIWEALKANNITIAFPQLDVHFDTPPPVVTAA